MDDCLRLSETAGPEVHPNAGDMLQALHLRSCEADIPPAGRQTPVDKPDGVLLLVINNYSQLLFSVHVVTGYRLIELLARAQHLVRL